jgi:hypothetical protein
MKIIDRFWRNLRETLITGFVLTFDADGTHELPTVEAARRMRSARQPVYGTPT